jgi:hypothetical protein
MHLLGFGPRVVAGLALIAATTVVALSAAPISSAAPSAHPCEPGDIEVVPALAGYGLGHWAVRLLIVDPGDRTCAFRGYPIVRAFTNPTKRWVTAARTSSGYMGGLQSGQPEHTVTINGDMVASVVLEGTDVPVNGATSCPTYVRITVALPHWRPSANLSLDNSACSRLEVHPIVYGPTGDQPPVY